MVWMTPVELRNIYPRVKFGVGCRIDARAVLVGDNIEIGDNVRIDMDAKLLAGGKNASIRIGSHVHIATDAILMGAGGIAIHDHCCVGMQSILCSATDDFSGLVLVGPQYNGEPGFTSVFKEKIVMHEFSIVTTGCLLLPGSTMDTGSVLGAGVVLPKGRIAKQWEIYAGNPAKKVRDRSMALKTVAGQWELRWIKMRAELLKESSSSPRPDTSQTESAKTP